MRIQFFQKKSKSTRRRSILKNDLDLKKRQRVMIAKTRNEVFCNDILLIHDF